MKKGFTLVELVIVIVIVGILSIVAVPIYKGYVEKAMLTEGKALASAVRTAEMIYYAEHGEYYIVPSPVGYDPVLQIDARGNKYFDTFVANIGGANSFVSSVYNDFGAADMDMVQLYWVRNHSAPADVIDGKKAPFFILYVDGKYL